MRTKLYVPPARPILLRRPDLIERLDEGLRLGRKLTLLSAPAGFGKTTLLSAWIHESRLSISDPAIENRKPKIGNRVAWVSLDERDNDPARFLAYLVGALQTVEQGLGRGLLGALQAPQPPPAESLLTGLVNELAALPPEKHTLIVLDDYHVIKAPPVHQAVAFLLDHLPPQVHLVIASRSDPPLPLARLRGRGLLTELRAADLRFTAEEAAAFLNQVMGLDLSPQDVAALEARTEGWITGLQLAALALRGTPSTETTEFVRAFTGSHRFVLDYLLEEVLAQQPPGIQAFLLQTSILERLSGPLCDEILDIGDWRLEASLPQIQYPIPNTLSSSQKMLQHLEAANLFLIPLDEQRCWYRYHRLFADLLRARLPQAGAALGCAPPPELHRRASRWFEAHGLADEAIRHALAAGNPDRAARLVEDQGLPLLLRGELTTLLGWLAALPKESLRARPWLCIYHAWALALSGQPDAAEPRLQAAEAASPAPVPDDRLGHVAAIRAYVAAQRGDVPRTVELAQEALDLLDEDNLVVRSVVAFTLGGTHLRQGQVSEAARALAEASQMGQAAGNVHLAVPALTHLADLEVAQGHLHRAFERYRQALALAEQTPVAAQAYSGLGILLHEWNDLEAARDHLARAIELGERWGNVDALTSDYAALACTSLALGDRRQARDALEKAEQLEREKRLHATCSAQVAACQVRLQLAEGNLRALERWLQAHEPPPDGRIDPLCEREYVGRARALLALDRLDEAARLLDRLLALAKGDGRLGSTVELLALQALVYQGQGRADEALATLEQALTLAEPEGYVRTFVDEGQPMMSLLSAASRQPSAASHQPSAIGDAYVTRLLAAFPDSRSPDTRLPAFPLTEPLSDRELEVLGLVARGLTNREIADELVIAVSTVKSHTNSIYGKLGVKNRTQAVAKAQELGLI